jgi:anaerobic glycerol-3-phosphate dehydrogenase
MSCRDKTKSTPNAMTIACFVRSKLGVCKVRANTPAQQVVEVENRSLFRWSIEIYGECETSHIRYLYGGNMRETWSRTLEVGPRPGSGGPRKRSEVVNLTSLGPGENESIRTDLTWTPIDWSSPGTEPIYMQLDTL